MFWVKRTSIWWHLLLLSVTKYDFSINTVLYKRRHLQNMREISASVCPEQNVSLYPKVSFSLLSPTIGKPKWKNANVVHKQELYACSFSKNNIPSSSCYEKIGKIYVFKLSKNSLGLCLKHESISTARYVRTISLKTIYTYAAALRGSKKYSQSKYFIDCIKKMAVSQFTPCLSVSRSPLNVYTVQRKQIQTVQTKFF